jgi:hypothetical protein
LWDGPVSVGMALDPGTLYAHDVLLFLVIFTETLSCLSFCREVLERAVHLKLSAKKMKLMFKRYLEFERQYGSPAGVEAVKDKARTSVETKLA